MPRQVAFLRGINLGSRRLKMDELAAVFEGFGVDDVATYLASGNVVFTAGRTDLRALERGLEQHLESSLGYPVDDDAAAALAALETPDDRLRPLDRAVLWLRRGGMANALISTRDLERALGGSCTQRTLNTVRRLVTKFA